MSSPPALPTTDEVTAFGAAAEWTGVRDDDREAWLDLRQTMLTASDVAAILGEDPRRDAYAVYVDKVTPRKQQEKISIYDPRFWGHVLEQPIAQAVANYYGWGFRRGGFLLRSRKHPIIGCTLDAEFLRSDSEGWIPYEGKTTKIPRDWDEESGTLPTRVLVQAQTQLLVTQAPRNLVFALLQGSRPVQIPVEPYLEFHALIVEECERFMDLVRRGEPPTPTAASRAAIERLHPEGDGSSVLLPIEAVEWTREIRELNSQMKETETRMDELKNRLRSHIGSATFGELPEAVDGKAFWRYQLQRREEHTVAASESRVLIAMKNGPASAAKALPASPSPVALLPESEDATVIRFKMKRKGAKR